MQKKTIAFFTTSRAEFGQIISLILKIKEQSDLDYMLFVGGTHLAPEYGQTIKEIESYDIKVTDTFDFLLNSSDEKSLTISTGLATQELASIFSNYNFDFALLLGDRFEMLSVVTAIILFRKPLIHISGGEVSEGALDNQVRHMITKSAHIHFAACEEYADNIRNMGEENWRVFNHGALAIDALVETPLILKPDLFKDLDLDPSKETVMLTYHPVTLSNMEVKTQISNLFKALESFNFQVVVTAPNMDIDRDEIYNLVKGKTLSNPNYRFFDSLGTLRYTSLIPHCKLVVGNSSSGMVQVPFFKVPTINVGDRQKGRLKHDSVVDTTNDVEDIVSGIQKAIAPEFIKGTLNCKFKYGSGNVAIKMIDTIRSIKVNEELLQKKLSF